MESRGAFPTRSWTDGRSGDRFILFYAGSGRDLRSEVVVLLLDAFAELEADEALELDASAGVLRGGRDDLGDRGLPVDHEQLRGERILLAELGEAALDHLLDDVLRLAAFLRLFHRDRALTLDQLRVERVRVERLRMSRRDMHRDLLAKRGQRLGGSGAL